MDPLEARSLIPLTAHYIHMNHAGVSPMTERSRAAIEQVLDGALNRPYPPGAAFEDADRVRGLAAQLINGSADGIALTRSTAHGMSLVAQGLDWNAGTTSWARSGSTRPTSTHGWLWRTMAVEYRQTKPVDGRVLT